MGGRTEANTTISKFPAIQALGDAPPSSATKRPKWVDRHRGGPGLAFPVVLNPKNGW